MTDPAVADVGTLSTGTDVTRTPGVPNGVVAGSLVLEAVAIATNAAPTVPAGWTNKLASFGLTPTLRLHFKRATGSDTGTYSVDAGSAVANAAIAIRITDAHPDDDPFGIQDLVSAASGTATPTTQITKLRPGSLVIWSLTLGAARTCTIPTGFTRITPDTSQVLHMAYKQFPDGGDTGAVAGSVSSTTSHQACLTEVRAASSVKCLSRTTGGTTAATSFPTTQAQAPLANSIQILTIAQARGTTLGTIGGLSGWTLLSSGDELRVTVRTGAYVYARVCSGGESAPTITSSASTAITWLLEEWSGLAGLPTSTGEVFDVSNSSGSGHTFSDSRTAGTDNEWVYAAFCARAGGTGAINRIWDDAGEHFGGAASGRTTVVYAGHLVIPTSGGSVTVSMTVQNSQGDGMEGVKLHGFPMAYGTIRVGGTNKVVNARSTLVGGAKKSQVKRSIISGGTKKRI